VYKYLIQEKFDFLNRKLSPISIVKTSAGGRVTRWGDLSPKGRQNKISGDFKKCENRPFFRRQRGRFWVKECIVKYLLK